MNRTKAQILLLCIAAITPSFTSAQCRTGSSIESSQERDPPTPEGKVSSSQARGRWRQRPIWRLDLRSAGFKDEGSKSNRSWNQSPGDSIYFTSDNAIVVTFSTHDKVEKAEEKRKQDSSQPSQIHVVFIDAATGHVRTTKEWHVPRHSSLIPTATGKLVLITPDRLVLFSSELQPLGALPLPPPGIRDESESKVFHSPSGKSLVLGYWNDGADSRGGNIARYAYDFVWIDTEKMVVLRKWRECVGENTWNGPELINASGGSLSDISDGNLVLGFHGATLVRTYEQPWRLLCYLLPYCGESHFVNDQTLLMYFHLPPAEGGKIAVALLGIDGRLMLTQPLGYNENDRLAPPQVSADGRRVAFLRYRREGELDFMDFHLRDPHMTLLSVTVLDAVRGRWVGGLEANKRRSKLHNFSSDPVIALSPGGTYLGFLCENIVEVYPLP